MNINKMYYVKDELKIIIKSCGGIWNDNKKRPMICLLKSTENDELYWAIPVGKVNHRDEKAMHRIMEFINKKDLRESKYLFNKKLLTLHKK